MLRARIQLDSRTTSRREVPHLGPAKLPLEHLDFEAKLERGVAVDCRIRYADIAPWYDYVEQFAGISGQPEGLPQLPDGKVPAAMR